MTTTDQNIPATFTAYKTTKLFTHETVPKGFTKEHSTSKGVWALLHVRTGSLQFMIDENGQEAVYKITPDVPRVIVEEQPHHIIIDGPVSFQLEFFRDPAAA